MSDEAHHEHLIKELEEQFEPVFSNSPQAIYLYLDDAHKTCNTKFADLLGYSSVDEWKQNEFPVGDVLEKDQKKVIEAYGKASQDFKASVLSATLVTKDKKNITAEVIMVPLTYKNEVFVLHFISEK